MTDSVSNDTDTMWGRLFDEQEPDSSNEGWVEGPETVDDPPSKDILSLLNLGEVKHTMSLHGHEIALHTLRMDEELEVGMLTQKYANTLEEGRALATALVAASIESIDGKPLVHTIGPGEDLLRKKFEYVRTRMYWPVIRTIYEEGYLPLVERQVSAIEEFRKK